MISTGKSDWERDITDDKASLAAAMLQVTTGASSHSQKPSLSPTNMKSVRPTAGLFRTADSTRTSVLNGSHRTICHENEFETVLVFPDYKVVTEVRRSVQGAQDLWDSAVDPKLGGAGASGAFLEKSPLKTWVLPYACVILLCECGFKYLQELTKLTSYPSPGSHKKRDNRCGIAAPKLEHGPSFIFGIYPLICSCLAHNFT